MDENRQFFRIKNTGRILAKIENNPIEIVDISATGVLIKKNNLVPKHGILELNIHNFSMNISYEVLRSEQYTMVLVFNKEEEINRLFLVLKNLRNEQSKQSE
ncbi:PilZ domain-containing protein [Legionella maioricensis]|uniref:PilZ domain-containing protein n=1 Tax=Legionella maioricensis TaxID=2896528 RepID=A0A9X2CYP6_9GAMM|nr:PilZ domain-containing protein [Legionella maioricensis]MCL9683216.1 PilZ domain-containing protein [Legionella maioricensis]MCL9686086.1 PilZ domain-containing protein [Legionella maioricensis]